MNRERISDIVLGVTMILIGVAPLGLVTTGRAQLLVSGYGFGTVSAPLDTALAAVFSLCGLLLAAAGVTVVRYGRSESHSTSLY